LEVGICPGQKFGPGNFLLPGLGRVSHLQVWKISLKNLKFSSFLPTGQKYLIMSVRKISRAKPGWAPFFTESQMYAWVRPGWKSTMGCVCV